METDYNGILFSMTKDGNDGASDTPERPQALE